MKTIWKYDLMVTDHDQVFSIPEHGEIIHVAKQRIFICLWVEVVREAPYEDRRFRVFGTGHDIPTEYKHRGTLQDESFVWHVYERMA